MKTPATVCCMIVIFSGSLYAQSTTIRDTDFKKADSIAASYPGHSLEDLKRLADKLTASLSTEEEKFRAIYTWICHNIEYDYGLFLRNQQKRKKLKDSEERKAWNKKISLQVFKKLREQQKTVCTGYAYLVKELASHAGLSCVIVDGYGRTAHANIRGSGNANHSWNAVQLNNKWYLCDATWSSGAYDAESLRYIKKFDPSYFLADPSLFVRNHYPLDSAWILLDDKPTLKAFLNAPLIYSSAFRLKIKNLVPETFDINTIRGRTVSFRFSTGKSEGIEKADLEIKGPHNTTVVHPSLYSESGGLYCINHIFDRKGLYVVHVLLNTTYAFTYTVTVK